MKLKRTAEERAVNISADIWIEAYCALLRSECSPSWAAMRADEAVSEWRKRYPTRDPSDTNMLEWCALTGQIRCLADCLVGEGMEAAHSG